MSPVRLYSKHLLSSFAVLCLLVVSLFLSKEYIEKAVSNLEGSLAIIFVSLIIIAVLFSYIVYLLLTYHSRFDLEIWNATKNMALSKEQFKMLYENAPVPYLLLDEEANIHEPNKATLRFFGVLPEQIIGKNIFSYIAGGKDTEVADMLSRHYKSSLPINRTAVDFFTQKGEMRSAELSVFKMKNAGSFSSTGLAMIFDITDQKKLDKAKTEFVSLASHQLKTPLTYAKWLTEVLTSGDTSALSAKQKEYLDKLHTANEDMIDLVDAFLNVSRIELGSLPIEMKLVNVEDLSDSLLKESSTLINEKNIKIEKEYNGFLKHITSDPKLLRIIMQNLISNALKYTPQGGMVTITFEESAGEKRIKISDTGLGIPKDQQSQIFSKLFRADNVRELSDAKGTGLGLYLVKSVVSLLGGSISFVSEENKGTVFTITL